MPEAPSFTQNYVAPSTETEERLAEIWCQVLKLNQVGIQDNFFELGGDSIISIQMAARANHLGIKLNGRDIFQYPTIAGLASVAEKARQVNQHALIPRSETGESPLIPIQQWFFNNGTLQEPSHWNQSALLRLSPDVQINLLTKALEIVFATHGAFRLRYHKIGKRWVQAYEKPQVFQLLQHGIFLAQIIFPNAYSIMLATGLQGYRATGLQGYRAH